MKASKCITKKVPDVGSLVVIRSKDESIKTIIKLTEKAGVNALNWPVFNFLVVHGITDISQYAVPVDEEVEVCIALIDSPKPADGAKVVFRPHHAHVEVSEGSNTYQVYRFVRRSMAMKLVNCAGRFGLRSFLITVEK